MPAHHLERQARSGDELPRVRILGVLLAMLALPVSSYFSGSSVGAYRMFTNVVRYHLQLTRLSSDGMREAVLLRELAPHLGAEARRIILPAARLASGETAAELLRSGQQDLAQLVCRLHPETHAVELVIDRRALSEPWLVERSELACDRLRAQR